MPDHPDLSKLVNPDLDPAYGGAEQAPTKRRPWSKPKVQTKATGKERREFRRAARVADMSPGRTINEGGTVFEDGE